MTRQSIENAVAVIMAVLDATRTLASSELVLTPLMHDSPAELARLQAEQQKTQEELRRTLSQLASVREEARGLIVTLPGSISV